MKTLARGTEILEVAPGEKRFSGPRWATKGATASCAQARLRIREVPMPIIYVTSTHQPQYTLGNRSPEQKMVSANFAMLLRRCRTRYKVPTHLSCALFHPAQPCAVSTQNPPFPPMPVRRNPNHDCRTSRIPTQHPWSSCHHYTYSISPIPHSIKIHLQL